MAVHTFLDVEEHFLIHPSDLAQALGLRLGESLGEDRVYRFLSLQLLPLRGRTRGDLGVRQLGKKEPRAKHTIGSALSVLQGGHPALKSRAV